MTTRLSWVLTWWHWLPISPTTRVSCGKTKTTLRVFRELRITFTVWLFDINVSHFGAKICNYFASVNMIQKIWVYMFQNQRQMLELLFLHKRGIHILIFSIPGCALENIRFGKERSIVVLKWLPPQMQKTAFNFWSLMLNWYYGFPKNSAVSIPESMKLGGTLLYKTVRAI